MIKQLLPKVVFSIFRKKVRKKQCISVAVLLLAGCAAQLPSAPELPHKKPSIAEKNCLDFLTEKIGELAGVDEEERNLQIGLLMFKNWQHDMPKLYKVASANKFENAKKIGDLFGDFCMQDDVTFGEASRLTYHMFMKSGKLE